MMLIGGRVTPIKCFVSFLVYSMDQAREFFLGEKFKTSLPFTVEDLQGKLMLVLSILLQYLNSSL